MLTQHGPKDFEFARCDITILFPKEKGKKWGAKVAEKSVK